MSLEQFYQRINEPNKFFWANGNIQAKGKIMINIQIGYWEWYKSNGKIFSKQYHII